VSLIDAPGYVDKDGGCVSTVQDLEPAKTDSNWCRSEPTFRMMMILESCFIPYMCSEAEAGEGGEESEPLVDTVSTYTVDLGFSSLYYPI
jgi:hypothetical protein